VLTKLTRFYLLTESIFEISKLILSRIRSDP